MTPEPELHCAYGCGEPVTHTEPVRFEVVGWEKVTRIRSSGKSGGSDVGMRKRTGSVMHEGCFLKMKMGLHPGQQTLV